MNFSNYKKAGVFIFTVSVFFLLLNISCTEKTKTGANDVVFDSIQVNKTQSIDYKDSKLNCNLHIAFIFPASSKKTSQLNDLQKIFIEKVFQSQDIVNLPPKDAANKFSEQYIQNFQSTKFDDFFDTDSMLEDENSFIYELSLENKILYNQNNFISFVVKNTNYEGGAHGSNSIYGSVINLNTGKILTEEDFAGTNYKKNLSPILAKKITAAKGLSDVSQLENNGYNAIEDIVPNGNFTIDDKGITYYFNEDEKIAAYFVGITEAFIPYEELKPYITEDNPISSLVDQ
jgi:hypothetical protein